MSPDPPSGDAPAPPEGAEVPVCAIGASAGGVTALREFFSQVSDELGFAYVVVMHLDPEKPSHLVEVLQARTAMPVREVGERDDLASDTILVIPPNRALIIDGNAVSTRPFSDPGHARAPIDLFFRSLARGRGDGIAVVLSGAGTDGAVGIQAVREAGGVILVQDPAEAEFPSMPNAAVATRAVDVVAGVSALAGWVADLAGRKRALVARSGGDEGAFRAILNFLLVRTGHNFSSYKRATLLRRINRRVQVARLDSIAAYAEYVRDKPEEAHRLFSDLLISVTMFFRDRDAFAVIAAETIPALFERAGEDGEIRVWAVGCATGEEPYSLAILLLEEARRRQSAVSIQIFATDLDEGALATAREGRYPKAIEADVPSSLLARHFVQEGNHYRIRGEVRDLVIFAPHGALREPPFMRLDLIVCRNLMIYLDRDGQNQLLALFHFGLKPDGYLFLGSAETADAAAGLFRAVNREARLYQPQQPIGGARVNLTVFPPDPLRPGVKPGKTMSEPHPEPAAAAHAASLEAHAPPSALIDEQRHILHLSETAGRFLLPSKGAFTPEVTALVRPELRLDLESALARAFKDDEPVLTMPIAVAFNGDRRRVLMRVAPLPAEWSTARRALVIFLDNGTIAEAADEPLTAKTDEVRRLEDELRRTQARLGESRRDHEAATQELRAANEELQSMNEEYRSTTEELETSKEELQSVNEELQTVNEELRTKLEVVSSAHNDLRNLVVATDIATLFLDSKMRIKLFSPAITRVIPVTEADYGRAISDFAHRVEGVDLAAEARAVLRDLSTVEHEARDAAGDWHLLRLRPYRTLDDRIEGVCLSFVDVTARREAERRLAESEAKYRLLFETMGEGFMIVEPVFDGGEPADMIVREANPAARALVPAEAVGRAFRDALPGFEPHWWQTAGRVLQTGRAERRELPAVALGRWYEVVAWRREDTEPRVAILFRDTTDRRRSEERLRESSDLLALATEASRLGWGTWDFRDGETRWDARGRAILGLADGEPGADWRARLHPEDRARVEAEIESCAREGRSFDLRYRVVGDGGAVRHVHGTGTFQLDPEGRPFRGTGLVRDVTEPVEAQERQELLVAELSHRVKNTLAVVQGIAQQTARGSASLDAFVEAFENRLTTLAAAHGLLTRQSWNPTALRALVEVAVAPYVAEGALRFEIRGGPGIDLSPNATISLAMALHELGTNATKHGALSVKTGVVEVAWRIEACDEGEPSFLVLTWTERGGPPAAPPDRVGYGTRMLEKGVARELEGRVELSFEEEGLVCTMEFPINGNIRQS